MKATIEIGQPSRTQHVPASPPKTRRHGWMAGNLAVLGWGVGIWWGVASYVGMLDRISAFERIPIPSSKVTTVSGPVTKVLYVEEARRTNVPALRFVVVDPSGRAVAVQMYEGDLRYDVPGEPGRIGRAVATFEADASGAYSIDVIGPNTAGAIVAIGDDVARSWIPAILGSLALLLISAAGGLLGLRISKTGRRSKP
jgi:hypothetical protein